MPVAAKVSLNRAADSHVSVAQQIAPRDTGLMADTTHKEQGESGAQSVSLSVIAPQPYSIHVEFGPYNQPWFLPSYESALRQFNSEARTVTNTILEDGSMPVSVVTISRSGPQRTAPRSGLTRKIP